MEEELEVELEEDEVNVCQEDEIRCSFPDLEHDAVVVPDLSTPGIF